MDLVTNTKRDTGGEGVENCQKLCDVIFEQPLKKLPNSYFKAELTYLSCIRFTHCVALSNCLYWFGQPM